MQILKRRYQYAVLWPLTGVDANSVPTFGAARELRVRWEHGNVLFTDDDGQQLVSSSRVLLGEDIKAGDALWEGRLSDVPDADDPLENDKVFIVRSFNKTPTLRATDYLREALL